MLCVMVFALTACADNTTTGNKTTGGTVTGNEQTAVDQTTNSQTNNTQATISEEEAKKIAFEDAGIAEADVKGLRIEKDREDGYYVYEVEFYSGDKEYDYKVDQTTGEIVGRDYEIENDFAY